MKTVGIIGGLGPETTSEFYLEVLVQLAVRGFEQRPRIIIESVPMDLLAEEAFIKSNKNHALYIETLINASKRLEDSGADFVVIPCNSVHIFLEDVRGAINIPVLSIVAETQKVVKASGCSTIGLLATSSTLENRIYSELESYLDVHVLDSVRQNELDGIILKLVNKRHQKNDVKQIKRLAKRLIKKNSLDCIILACTDLQIVLSDLDTCPVYDTMTILARATVDELLKNSSD